MQVTDEVEGYSVIIDDDGTVAYAYLLDSGQKIVSDVWLYNHGPTPVSVDRSDRDALPFRNPEGFASAIVIEPLQKTSDILIEWKRSLGRSIQAHLFIRGQLFAVLQEGIAPAWSRLAIQNGPLAQVLEV